MAGASRAFRWAWTLVAFVGLTLIGSGLAAITIAATTKMLPPDVRFLGMDAPALCAHHDCRIVQFMVHDRVAFGGSIIATGIIYVWLASAPLRGGFPWAWWTLAISGTLGFASFLTYLGRGYLDPWHGLATALLLPVFLAGMAGTFPTLRRPAGAATLLAVGTPAGISSRIGIGRVCMLFAAFGMISGGLTIMGVGMTTVFVPQDLDYIGLSAADLNAISPNLVALIAHDRAGFGGGLCSGGLAILGSVWCGLAPGDRWLWCALLAAGIVGFTTAIGIHFLIGYTDFLHLLPAYFGALVFGTGSALLWRPMSRRDSNRP